MAARRHPLFDRVARLAERRPVVVAHRGDSANHPENTLAAFRAAAELGVVMQEFDVRATADGHLVCIHDANFDRTTNGEALLGPGSLVADTDLATAQQLDAGSWHPRGEPATLPTLAAALDLMLPDAVPLIEHKAGSAGDYVAELRRLDALEHCILQSFDWHFIRAAHELAPALATAVLGPTRGIDRPDDAAIALAHQAGAGMLHWDAHSLRPDDVERAHRAGLLVCTYTTDDEAGFRTGHAQGVDAICTNVPATMLALDVG